MRDEQWSSLLDKTIPSWQLLLHCLQQLDQVFCVQGDMRGIFQTALNEQKTSQQKKALKQYQTLFQQSVEGIYWNNFLYLATRWSPGKCFYFKIPEQTGLLTQCSIKEYLDQKENAFQQHTEPDAFPITIDFTPFDQRFPKLKDRRSIGRGGEFLNRHLANRLFQDSSADFQMLLEFLGRMEYQGQKLLLLDRKPSLKRLQQSLDDATTYLSAIADKTPWTDIADDLTRMGLAPGWGSNAKTILRNLELLQDLLEAPDPRNMEEFVRTIPGVFDIVILSPHGYFGQAGVLGLPDTGGQVVYILDQVRALEKELKQRLAKQGIETDPRILVITRQIPEAADVGCNVPKEKINGTENSWILRVPFRDASGQVLPQWISRFQVWPYLQNFALETEREVYAELRRTPDLVVGNYSDGNYVASILADRMGCVQCNIAHALEKSKYLFSALYWRENEEKYHFSTQFTADLLSMNRADFLITSTYQEIAGGPDSMGQYESYNGFTMPGLYRVHQGIDVFDPKFNIISPGCDENCYFSYQDQERRLLHLHPDIEKLVLEKDVPNTRGCYKDPGKPIIFSMARMDTIKNLPALVEWFGAHPTLRKRANLLVVSGYVDVSKSKDHEEQEMIQKMHELIDRYELDAHIRWSEQLTDRIFNGELYRWVADHQGIFVQPALFEAFGLTVIEAMTTGLPTFATCYGGPLEIIEHQKSGFHIDPNQGEVVAQQLNDFFAHCKKEPAYWTQISQAGMQRVEERFTWKLYANRMISLAQVYAFWNHITTKERAESRAYLDLFHKLQMRQLIANIPQADMPPPEGD